MIRTTGALHMKSSLYVADVCATPSKEMRDEYVRSGTAGLLLLHVLYVLYSTYSYHVLLDSGCTTLQLTGYIPGTSACNS